jgi:hypothetical protein
MAENMIVLNILEIIFKIIKLTYGGLYGFFYKRKADEVIDETNRRQNLHKANKRRCETQILD